MRLNAQQEALIRERIAYLPDDERAAIYLRFWDQAKFSTIATYLGIETAQVSIVIDRALSRLQLGLRSIEVKNFNAGKELKAA